MFVLERMYGFVVCLCGIRVIIDLLWCVCSIFVFVDIVGVIILFK